MFRISKIYIYESNSQPGLIKNDNNDRCSEYQRYTFMKAIHNQIQTTTIFKLDVQNIKDIHLWKQFTTVAMWCLFTKWMFRISKIYIYESNSQHLFQMQNICRDVQNIKDIHLWKQFTTSYRASCCFLWCSEYQRYTFMKAIHNYHRKTINGWKDVQNIKDIHLWKQFTTRNAWQWKRH